MPLQTVLETSIFLIADSTRGGHGGFSPLLVSWKLAGVQKSWCGKGEWLDFKTNPIEREETFLKLEGNKLP